MTADSSNGTTRAAVFRGAGEPLSIESVQLPSLEPGEALVRVTCCTLCGSDLHTYAGKRPTPLPTILGHEILGEVVAVGGGEPPCDSDGVPVGSGARITWSVAASCGSCFFCKHEIPQKCDRLFKYGHEKLDRSLRHMLSGGLADHCHLAAGTAMVRVPDSVSDHVACPANCATATVTAAMRAANIPWEGQTILVQGAGMLGLTACAMARTRGARSIVATDTDPSRLNLALRFGATDTFNVADGGAGLHALLEDLTDGRGADAAFELSGSPAAVASGLEALRIGGRQVLVGSVFPTDPVALQPEAIVRGLKSICGVHNYAPQDLADGVTFLTQHQEGFPFDELVGGSFPLDEVTAAFEAAATCRAPRVAVAY